MGPKKPPVQVEALYTSAAFHLHWSEEATKKERCGVLRPYGIHKLSAIYFSINTTNAVCGFALKNKNYKCHLFVLMASNGNIKNNDNINRLPALVLEIKYTWKEYSFTSFSSIMSFT